MLAVEIAVFAKCLGHAANGFVIRRAVGETHTDELADAMLFHGHTVEHVGPADRALVVRDDDELALTDELVENLDESADVRFVQRRVHLVQHAEGAGLHHVDGEEQGHGRHRALATGQERYALQLLAGRLGDNVDAGLERVILIHEDEIRLTSAEELGEHDLEVIPDLVEGIGKEFLRGAIDLADHLQQLGLRVDEVGILLLEEDLALFEFLVFLNGLDIDGAHGVEALCEFLDDLFDARPVNALRLNRQHGLGLRNKIVARLRRPLFGRSGGHGIIPGGFGLLLGSAIPIGAEQRVGVGLEFLEVELIALGDMGANILHAHFHLGLANFETPFLLLQFDHLTTGAAKSGIDGFGLRMHFLASGGHLGDLHLHRAEFLGPDAHGVAQAGAFAFQALDAALRVCDVLTAGVEEFGEFRHASRHGSALTVEIFLLLALGGHTHAHFVERFDRSRFPLTGRLDRLVGLRTGDAGHFQRGQRVVDILLEILHGLEAGAKGFLDLGSLTGKGGATGFEVRGLTFRQFQFILDRRRLNLGGLYGTAGIKQLLLGVFQGLDGLDTLNGETFQTADRLGQIAIQIRDLRLAHEHGLRGIFARLSAANHTVTSNDLAIQRHERQVRMQALEGEGHAEALDHDRIKKQLPRKQGPLACSGEAISRPDQRALGQRLQRGQFVGNPLARQYCGASQLLADERGDGGLRHGGILEKNRLQRTPQSGFHRWDIALFHPDMIRDGTVQRGLEQLGIVESAQDGLGALVKALALFLKLAQHFETGLDTCGLLGGGVQGVLGFLAGLLRGVQCILRLGLTGLRSLKRGAGIILTTGDILQADICLGHGLGGGIHLTLQQALAGLTGFTPPGCGGDLTTQGIKASLQARDVTADLLEGTLHGRALFPSQSHVVIFQIQFLLVIAQGVDHASQLHVGFLDLILLDADLLLSRGDIRTVPVDETARLVATLDIRGDPVLR